MIIKVPFRRRRLLRPGHHHTKVPLNAAANMVYYLYHRHRVCHDNLLGGGTFCQQFRHSYMRSLFCFLPSLCVHAYAGRLHARYYRPGSGLVTAALCALLREGKDEEALQWKPPKPLFMAAEINPRAAAACLLTAKANKVRRRAMYRVAAR